MQSGVFILFMWWYKMYQHKGNMYFKSVLNMKYIAVLQAWNFRCIPQQWGQQSFRGDYCQAPFLCHLEKLNGKICGEPIIIRIPIKGGMTIQLTEGMCVWGNGAWQELPVENCRCKSSSLNRPCLQWQRLTDGSIVNDCKCSIPFDSRWRHPPSPIWPHLPKTRVSTRPEDVSGTHDLTPLSGCSNPKEYTLPC